MKLMNRVGPPLLGGFREPPRLDDAGIVDAVERGDAVVDVRPTKDLLAGAIPGVLGIPVGGSFPTWAGALLPYDRPITLLAPDRARVLAAVRQLAQIGLDDVAGWFGEEALAVWAHRKSPLAVTPDIAPESAFARAQHGEIALLDVRGTCPARCTSRSASSLHARTSCPAGDRSPCFVPGERARASA